MNKEQKLHKKQEKRIIKLLYSTGILKEMKLDPVDLYVNCYERGKSVKKRRRVFRGWCPNLNRTRDLLSFYNCTRDYWGEYDEHLILSQAIDLLWWKNHNGDSCESNYGYGTSRFKFKSRKWFIKYLSKLPTVIHDNRIRKYTRVMDLRNM